MSTAISFEGGNRSRRFGPPGCSGPARRADSAGVTTRRLAGLLPLRHPRYRPPARGSHRVLTRSRSGVDALVAAWSTAIPGGNRGGAGDPLTARMADDVTRPAFGDETHRPARDPPRSRDDGAPRRRRDRHRRGGRERPGDRRAARRRGRGRRRGRCRRARRRGDRRADRRSRWHGPVRPCRHARPRGRRGARRRRGRAARARQQRGRRRAHRAALPRRHAGGLGRGARPQPPRRDARHPARARADAPRGRRAIVNVASTAGLGLAPYQSPEYAAAKAGLIRFTSTLGAAARALRRARELRRPRLDPDRARGAGAGRDDARGARRRTRAPAARGARPTRSCSSSGTTHLAGRVVVLRGGEPPRLLAPDEAR